MKFRHPPKTLLNLLIKGNKKFEIRNNNRDYKVHDVLVLNEYDPIKNKYTGRSTEKIISYITDFEQKENYIVLGLKDRFVGQRLY